jgi:hypothetical protein
MLFIKSYRPNAVAPKELKKSKSVNLVRPLITHPLHPFQNPLLTNPLTNRKTSANV